MIVSNEKRQDDEFTAERVSQEFIKAVVDSPAILGMADAYGYELPEDYTVLDMDAKVVAVQHFAKMNLDVRKQAAEMLGVKNAERWEVKEVVHLTKVQAAAVKEFKDEFHMEGDSYAKLDKYSIGFVLGAKGDYVETVKESVVHDDGSVSYVSTGETAFREGSVTLRVRKLRSELERGVKIPYVVLMGSARPIGKDEKLANPNIETEYDSMNAAFEREFADQNPTLVYDDRAASHNKQDPEGWKIRQYTLEGGTNVFSISAPRVSGWPRANTPDTYRFVDALIDADLLDGNDALIVTTDLYVPFQHASALSLLGLKRNFKVESVGYGGADRPMVEYAPEVKSTIDKVAGLHKELAAKNESQGGALNPLSEMREQVENIAAERKAEVLNGIVYRIKNDHNSLGGDVWRAESKRNCLPVGSPERQIAEEEFSALQNEYDQKYTQDMACFEMLYDIDPNRVDPTDAASLKVFGDAGSALVRLNWHGESISMAITEIQKYIEMLKTLTEGQDVIGELNQYARSTDIKWLPPGLEGFGALKHVITYAYMARGHKSRRESERIVAGLSSDMSNDYLSSRRGSKMTEAWLIKLPALLQQLDVMQAQELPAVKAKFLERYAAGERLSTMNSVEEQYDEHGSLKRF